MRRWSKMSRQTSSREVVDRNNKPPVEQITLTRYCYPDARPEKSPLHSESRRTG
jgi:hypothetical protein